MVFLFLLSQQWNLGCVVQRVVEVACGYVLIFLGMLTCAGTVKVPHWHIFTPNSAQTLTLGQSHFHITCQCTGYPFSIIFLSRGQFGTNKSGYTLKIQLAENHDKHMVNTLLWLRHHNSLVRFRQQNYFRQEGMRSHRWIFTKKKRKDLFAKKNESVHEDLGS